jgi:hypothetical protein
MNPFLSFSIHLTELFESPWSIPRFAIGFCAVTMKNCERQIKNRKYPLYLLDQVNISKKNNYIPKIVI